MENVVKELKEEFLGKEVELLELDNYCQQLANDNNLRFNSIFEGEYKNFIEEGSFAFLEKDAETWEGINIEFQNINFKRNNDVFEENVFGTLVKVTNIDLI